MRPSPSVSSRIVILSAPRGPRGGGSGRRSYLVRRYRSTVDRLQSGWIRILQVLNDPNPPAIVEGHGHRLPHVRLTGDQADVKALGCLEPLESLVRRKGLGGGPSVPQASSAKTATIDPGGRGSRRAGGETIGFATRVMEHRRLTFPRLRIGLVLASIIVRADPHLSDVKNASRSAASCAVTWLRISSGINDFCCGSKTSISSVGTRIDCPLMSLSTACSAVRSVRKPA